MSMLGAMLADMPAPFPLPIGLRLSQTTRVVERAFDEALGEAGGSGAWRPHRYHREVRPDPRHCDRSGQARDEALERGRDRGSPLVAGWSVRGNHRLVAQVTLAGLPGGLNRPEVGDAIRARRGHRG